MREHSVPFLFKHQGKPAISQQLHKELGLPGRYAPVRPLRYLYFEVGRALLDQSLFSEAITNLEQALKEVQGDIDIPDWEINVCLAAAYAESKKPEQAFHTYLVAVLQAPDHASLILERAHQLLTRSIVRAESAWLTQEWATICTSSDVSSQQSGSINLFLGRVYLYLKQYADAIHRFEQALRVLPDNVYVLEGLGQALFFNGETARSVTILQRAYELAKQGKQSNRYIPVTSKLVRALTADGQYKRALSSIPAAVTADTAYAYEFFFARSQCHLALGEPNPAIDAARLATSCRTTACEPYLLIAQSYIVLQDYPKAVEATKEALLRDPSNPSALLYEAQALLEGNIDRSQGLRLLESYQEDTSEKAIQKLIQTAPFIVRASNAALHYFLAQFYYVRASYSEAEQELNRAFELKFLDANHRLEAPAQWLQGDLLVKKGLYSQEKSEQAATCYYEAGVKYYDQAAYAEASSVLQQAIEIKPDHALSYIYQAASQILLALPNNESYNPGELEKALTKALKVWQEGAECGIPSPYQAWAFYIRSLALRMLGYLKMADEAQTKVYYWEAVYYLERAVLLSPDNDAFLSFLGFCYTQLEKLLIAFETSSKEQRTVDLLFTKAIALVNIEDPRAIEVIADYRRLIQNDTTAEKNPYFEYLAGVILYLDGKYAEAINSLNVAIEMDPTDLNSRLYRGRAYRILHQSELAHADFQHTLEVTASEQQHATSYAMLMRVNAYYELTHYSDALGLLKQALDLSLIDPFNIYINFAVCYLALQNIQEAEKAFQAAMGCLPGLPVALHSSLQDLAEYEQYHLGEYGQTAPVQEILAPYREALQRKYQQVREQIIHGRSAKQELLQPVEQGEHKVGSDAWFASYAGAARLALRDQQLDEAILYYQTLFQYDKTQEITRFPEAQLGLARALMARGLKEACENSVEEALPTLRSSFDLFPHDDQNNLTQELAEAATAHMTSLQNYQLIAEVIHLITHDISVDFQQRRELILAQFSFNKEKYPVYFLPDLSHLSIKEKLTSQFVGEGSIALELGSGLIDENLVQKQLVEADLPAMRADIVKRTGVMVPGIRVRDNKELAYNAYQIVFYNGLRSSKTILISRSSHFMRDAYKTILSHLEVLISVNFSLLLGVQEVQVTLEGWKQKGGEERSTLIKEVLPDDLAVARFAQVLRRLVQAGFPIVDLEIILKAFKTMREEEIDATAKHIGTLL